jgi:DNA-binding transcriptional MerR regulator
MKANLFSIADAARILGIAESRISYAHRVRGLEDATHKVAGKRVYTEGDLHRLAVYFKVPLDLAREQKGGDHE